MVREDPSQHFTAISHSRTLGYNRSRHGIITSDADAQQDTETKEPPHLAHRIKSLVGQADDHDDTDHGDNKLLAIDEFAAEGIAEKAEHELTNDIANVRTRVDSTFQ